MLNNKKNILFKALAKNLRRVKEIRSSGMLGTLDTLAITKNIDKEFPSIANIWEARKIVFYYKGDILCLCPQKLIVLGKVRESMKNAFADFLKKRRIYDCFQEYKRHGGRDYTNYTDVELSENVLHWISSSGFYWHDTREGFYFWSNVNEEWRDFCLTTTVLDDSDEIRENVSF